MRVAEWRGRSRTSLELPFYPCAQGNENTRSIRQFEEGEGTCPPSKEIKDSARHPKRLERKNYQPGSNIPMLPRTGGIRTLQTGFVPQVKTACGQGIWVRRRAVHLLFSADL
jgi:hypothetical protein